MKQKRQYAAHFEYPDKPIKELGVVKEWANLVPERYQAPGFGPHPNQAPDCVVLDEKRQRVGVEVCELVDRAAIEKSLNGEDVYRAYGKKDFLSAVARLLQKKSSRKYYGEYARIIVLLHTDEMDLSFERCEAWLREKTFFGIRNLAEAYLLFSYRPRVRYQYLPISISAATFRERVLAVVRDIPAGETLTYREVAARAGNPRACRAAGNILHANFDPTIPCHRVVRADGGTGGYNRGAGRKAELLRQEGAL